MIYVTGDCHGEVRKFMSFPEEKNMDRNDHMIVCGDLGLVWNGGRSEKVSLDWLEEKPYTLLWVDGNHENYDMLKTCPRIKCRTLERIRCTLPPCHSSTGKVLSIS